MKPKESNENDVLSQDPPGLILGKRRIGRGYPVFIIAEAGSSHRGDIVRAREMIDAAAENGADSVKFQWIIADEIVHPDAGSILLHGREVPIWEQFHKVERAPGFYKELKEYCEKKGLIFLCSPFGRESARGLLELGVDAVKIASPELNHYPLLEMVRHLPLILSTGVSRLTDIEESLEYIHAGDVGLTTTDAGVPTAILHCITAYPAPEREYNLDVLPVLSKIFGTTVGVSDHSRHPLKVPVLAVAKGARIIEKHITLSRKDGGLDDPIALEPREFGEMSRAVREAEFLDENLILESCTDMFGRGEVAGILGNGKKELAPAERAFYGTTRRSLVALKDLPAGEILTEENSAFLRSEQQRSPGIPPRFREQIRGTVLQKEVRASEGITWNHLLGGEPEGTTR